MALREIEEIKKAVKDKQDSITSLRNRWEDDYELWRLKEYNRGKDYESYTSNKPRTLANKLISLLATSQRTIRIPLGKDDAEQRKAKSDAERFVIGALNLADSRLESMLQPGIQAQLAFFGPVRGWVALRVYIRKHNGQTIPDIAVWDPLHTYWAIGPNGLAWVCHTRTATAEDIGIEYDIEIKTKKGTVYDFWDDEIYLVFADDKFLIETKEHNLGHLPVYVGQVGSVPFIASDRVQDTIKDVGESVFAPIRGIIGPLQKIISDYTTIVGQGVHNPLAISSSGGKKGFPTSPYYKGAVVELDTDKGEKVEPLFTPVMPRDAQVLWAAIEREWSTGGLPPAAFGIFEGETSGRHLSLLHHAAEAVILAPKSKIEKTYEWIARELLTQFAKGGFGKLKLQGRDGTNEDFVVELAPKDVKGDWFPKVELTTRLPEDEPANMTMAQIAVETELLSRQTARDKYLGVQDTDAETEKIFRERAMSMPPIMLRRMAASLIAEGRPDLAQIFIDEIERSEGGTQKTPYQARRAEAKAEAVEPQFATGMSREVLPSEELGKVPVTEEERLARMGMVRR